MQVPIIYPMCDANVEQLLDPFFHCKFAEDRGHHKVMSFDINQIESTPQWLLKKLSTESQEVVVKIAGGIIWELVCA